MSKNPLGQLSKDELIALIEEYAKLYMALDGLWFLAVEKGYGHDVAEKLDVEVWKSLIPMEARRVVNARKLSKGGLEAVIEAFKFRPSFLTKEYEITKRKNKAIVRVTKCRSLHAMERDKREVSSCLKVLEDAYPRFAKNIDSRINFRVKKAPPRKSADDTCCEWEIELK
ncbi:MAG: DUF6125 family protein [Chloroflexota bacterium]